MLDEHFTELGAGTQSGTIVFRADQGVDDPEVTAAMEALFALVDAGFPDEDGVPEHPGATVISPYSEQGEGQIAGQGPLADELAYAQVNLAADIDLTESALIGEAIAEHTPRSRDSRFPRRRGARTLRAAGVGADRLGVRHRRADCRVRVSPRHGPAGRGSRWAASEPASSATLLLSNVYPIPDFTLSVGVMIGLGVGIDYALFIVTRYREGTLAGMSPRAATLAAMDTAGRAVIFAGITVVISLLGMLLMGIPLVAGVGLGASVTVLLTMISSLTLVPALLASAQERIEVTRWRGLVAAGLVAVALLGAGIGFAPLAAGGAILAAATLLVSFAVRPLRRQVPRRSAKPVRDTAAYRWRSHHPAQPLDVARRGNGRPADPGVPHPRPATRCRRQSDRPEGTYTRQAYDLLAEGFGEGFNGPFLITMVPGAGPGAGNSGGGGAGAPAVAGRDPRGSRRHRAAPRRPDGPRSIPHDG